MINRRKYQRFPIAGTPCRIVLRGRTVSAMLVNESIEGLRVGGLAIKSLARGEQIQVMLDDRIVEGLTRSVSRSENENFEIGVQREDFSRYSDDAESRLLARYINFNGHLIVCEVCCSLSADSRLIRLLNGKELEVKPASLVSLSMDERRAILEADEELEAIEQIYKAFLPDAQLESVESILELEFSPAD
ncbi:MAG: PilZ domain-containing protein [Planctomycetota bacterium]